MEKNMFDNLPQTLKEEVLQYLATDNFVAAKAVYDTWHVTQIK